MQAAPDVIARRHNPDQPNKPNQPNQPNQPNKLNKPNKPDSRHKIPLHAFSINLERSLIKLIFKTQNFS
ncbi:MAG: hypothetical protein C4519_26035 [Desulfobacteraceae bacterium]|nr:MAG: hypothetical protein C4519_26035 [Desulfobacteraceae bacterium]